VVCHVERLEDQNKNLQYELQEVAVHLNSYKDRFEKFQKLDLKSNKETNDYLCN
jgi:predicted RNase H-like nuclease (RuvC/YqgF family)